MNRQKQTLRRRTFLKGLGAAASALALRPFASLGQQPILIGAVIPLSGALASFGPRFQVAAQLALDEVNAAGGVLGRRVELIVRDDGTNPAQGVAAATDLINVNRVQVIFGPAASGVTIPVSSVTVPAGVVLISPSATSPAITRLNDNDLVFRTAPPDSLQGIVLADLAYNTKRYRRIAIIARNDAYGAGLAEATADNFRRLGGQVTAIALYETTVTDFSAQIAQARAGNPDAISLITFDEGEALITQMVRAGATNFDLLVDGNKNQDLIDRLVRSIGAAPLEGKVGTAPALAPGAGGDAFARAYRTRLNEDPFVFTPHSFDALAIVCLAIQRAGEYNGLRIRDNLRTVANPPGDVFTVGQLRQALEAVRAGRDINYEGASGSVDLDRAGEPVGPVGTWTIRNGRIVEMEVYQCTAGDPPTCRKP
ncbi:MAG: ABC transporter substrate-binding protein [Candidatus Bipolaricaulota bacterium]|nr:ABC transporter substrate-binding protein [Candidatus Bipolaricaulota bacterium]MDW8141294.1 ABC transporter substrate-binding protein [Candidatus Bipolaricaulota bacterium]